MISAGLYLFAVSVLFNICSSSVVYVQYSRKIPSIFPGDKYVEEIVEEFDTPIRPPEFGHSNQEIACFFRRAHACRPPTAATRPTPNRDWNREPTTHRSVFNKFWNTNNPSTTTSTTSTTPRPWFYTTEPYANSNPDYSHLIPTITTTIVRPSSTERPWIERPEISPSTTEKKNEIEYYDSHEDSKTTEATGPIKVTLPTLFDNESGEDEKGNPREETTTQKATIQKATTQKAIVYESTTEEEKYEYEYEEDDDSEDYEESKPKVSTEASKILAPTETSPEISTTTKSSLWSIFR